MNYSTKIYYSFEPWHKYRMHNIKNNYLVSTWLLLFPFAPPPCGITGAVTDDAIQCDVILWQAYQMYYK